MPQPNHKTNILVVDDHPVLREGLRVVLEMEGDLEVCAEAGDFGEAIQAVEQTRPEVAIIDICLGGRDGLELIGELRRRDPSLRILALSHYPEGVFAKPAIRAGAKGYLTKAEASETIVTAIRTVLRGGIHLREALKDEMLLEAVDGTGTASKDPIDRLSPRQRTVFWLLGEGKRPAEIARQLCISRSTVDVCLWRMKKKLHVESTQELVRSAVQWVDRQSRSQ